MDGHAEETKKEGCEYNCTGPKTMCADIVKDRITNLGKKGSYLIEENRADESEECLNFTVTLLAVDSLNYAGVLQLTLGIEVTWQSDLSRWDSCQENKPPNESSIENACDLFVNRTKKFALFVTQPSKTKNYDFKLINDANSSLLSKKMEGFPLVIHRNGAANWSGIIQVAIKCNLDVTRFPLDNQTCNIAWKLIPWRKKIQLKPECRKGEEVDNTDWTVRGFKLNDTTKVCQLILERRSMKWIATLVLPFGAFNFLVSLVYFLPPSSGERVGYSVTLVLSFSVILMAVGDLVPSSETLFPMRECQALHFYFRFRPSQTR